MKETTKLGIQGNSLTFVEYSTLVHPLRKSNHYAISLIIFNFDIEDGTWSVAMEVKISVKKQKES